MSAKKKRTPSAESAGIAWQVLGMSGRPVPPLRRPSNAWSATQVAKDQLNALIRSTEDQRANFHAEEAAFRLKAKTAMDDAANKLARLLDAVTAAEQDLKAAEIKSSNAHVRLNYLTNKASQIKQKMALAEAAKTEAMAERNTAKLLREQLERALADLRAYPTAKIEAWSLRRQEMDPKAEPRFPAIEAAPFSGVSG